MSCALPKDAGGCTVAGLLALIPDFDQASVAADLLIQPAGDLMTDSRQISEGDVFLAVKTEFGNGKEYIANALSRGAVCCLVDSNLLTATAIDELPAQVIPVPDLSSRSGRLAADYYANPSARMPVIGITGTNGKSSCVHFLAQMAGNIWPQPGSMIGTMGWGVPPQLHDGTHTTPDSASLQRLLAALTAQDVSLAAIEVSSHALLQQRPAGTRFAVAAFTNLTQDHLDYHGDMAAYGQAKQRLFSDYQLDGAVVGIDDQYGRELADFVSRSLPADTPILTTSSISRQADICVTNGPGTQQTSNGLTVNITTPWGEADVQTSLLGGFNAANLATCIACLGMLQAPFEQIVNAVKSLQPVPGRMQCLTGQPQQPLVIVDYAHTPDALDNALRSCRQHTRDDLWCVFGCGGDRDRSKRAMMGSVAERLADRIIITSDNPRNEDPEAILDDIRKGFQEPGKTQSQADREQAIRLAITSAGSGDCILIAGKGHERTQQIGEQRLPFDDVAVAERALELLT